MPDGPGVAEEVIGADEAAATEQFIAFLKSATLARHRSGPRRRFNQGRATACVNADFVVPDNLPPERRVGLFAAPRRYSAVIRFANASSLSDRERDVRGMAIRVLGVEGRNLTPGERAHDFVLNSHPVMMVADTRSFLDLLQANEAGGVRRALYFLTHPRAALTARASRTNPTCHLDLSYWSTTPYLFGAGRAVKYIVRPAGTDRSPAPQPLTDTYLTDAIRARLAASAAAFDFLIQFQTDGRRMPIEDASIEWKEEDSPYVPVARIHIPPQPADNAALAAECERMAFNPWQCLEEHRPLGNMNRARRAIYAAMAAFRAETAPI